MIPKTISCAGFRLSVLAALLGSGAAWAHAGFDRVGGFDANGNGSHVPGLHVSTSCQKSSSSWSISTN